MTARRNKRGGIAYYYGLAGKKIPLGGCPVRAMQRWAEIEAGEQRDPEELLDATQILRRSIPLKPVAGIYFLIVQGAIKYVGRSRNLFKRLEEHRLRRVFDSYAVLPCAAEDAAIMEARYIAALRPEWNGLGTEIRNTTAAQVVAG